MPERFSPDESRLEPELFETIYVVLKRAVLLAGLNKVVVEHRPPKGKYRIEISKQAKDYSSKDLLKKIKDKIAEIEKVYYTEIGALEEYENIKKLEDDTEDGMPFIPESIAESFSKKQSEAWEGGKELEVIVKV